MRKMLIKAVASKGWNDYIFLCKLIELDRNHCIGCVELFAVDLTEIQRVTWQEEFFCRIIEMFSVLRKES